MAAKQPEQQHELEQLQAAPSSKAPPALPMSTVVWSVTKAALLGTVLGIIALLPVAAVGYAAWLHCPQALLAAGLAGLAGEAFFVLYYFFVIAKQLNAIPDQHNPPADYNPQQLVASFLQHMARVGNIQGYLSEWFLDAPFDSIRHDNVKELVAFALFFKTPEQVEQQGLMPQLDALLAELSSMHDLQLPPGYNPDLKFMSHLWGDTPHMYRPLIFYIVMEIIELLSWGILACCGFNCYNVLGCTYYTYGLPAPQQQQQQQQQHGTEQQRSCGKQQRQHNAAASSSSSSSAVSSAAGGDMGADRMPLLVLHGVGAGLLPYLGVVLSLAATGQPMVLPVWKQVSMRLMRHILTVDESVEVVLAALQRHGLATAAVFGHSYGSLVAARLIRVAPQVVHTLAVVDPVCFAMHMPNLVKYFLYAAHVSGNRVADAFIALLRSEIHCARNFTRNFFWATINLFDEHLPERTLVVLSGTDLLCPTAYVRQWLENHTSATVLYHATASHGAGLLLHLPWQCTILNSVLSVMGQAGEAGSAAAAAAVAVAETAAAGPDKAAVVAAGHGAAAAAGTAGHDDGVGQLHGADAAEGDAQCCVAAADARVLAVAGCWSDGEDDAEVLLNGDNKGSSCGMLGVGTPCVSDTGADSGPGESSLASESKDVGGSDVIDRGSSDVKDHSKRRPAGVDASAAASARADAGGSRQRGSMEGDGMCGLSGSFMSGLDQASDLQPLKEAASSLAPTKYQVAAVSAGSLVGALTGNLQQLQRAPLQG